MSVDGWDFSWLDGRASEQRPSWGHARAMGERLARATAALDLQTGGGEVLAEAPRLPPLTVATALLRPLGVAVVLHQEGPLPFGDAAFDLVTSRHPVSVDWPEVARVLLPGGCYFSQHVGPASVSELTEDLIECRKPSR